LEVGALRESIAQGTVYPDVRQPVGPGKGEDFGVVTDVVHGGSLCCASVGGWRLVAVEKLFEHLEQFEDPGVDRPGVGGFGAYPSLEPTGRGPADVEEKAHGVPRIR
jgi:hypothetical protein